jgi:hypothetical protein
VGHRSSKALIAVEVDVIDETIELIIGSRWFAVPRVAMD